MENGCILLSRNILESDVFASQKLLKIWIWCLCKASFKDKSVPLNVGKGETIIKLKRGEFVFGRFKAEEQLFIDGSTIYKSILKLQELEMISIKSNNQYSIITICNYDKYQSLDSYKVASNEQPSNNQVASNEQPSNTTKNVNNVKKVKKEIYIPEFSEFKNYALENKPNVDLESLELKYKSWIANGWKNGNNKEIKNWKSALLNTLPYIKESNDKSKLSIFS